MEVWLPYLSSFDVDDHGCPIYTRLMFTGMASQLKTMVYVDKYGSHTSCTARLSNLSMNDVDKYGCPARYAVDVG